MLRTVGVSLNTGLNPSCDSALIGHAPRLDAFLLNSLVSNCQLMSAKTWNPAALQPVEFLLCAADRNRTVAPALGGQHAFEPLLPRFHV